jgi:isoaspartyl peptidase/L-asparaginase-like protein (Ntn-hydrolase superfamily)
MENTTLTQACAPLLIDGMDSIECVEKGVNAVELDNRDQYFVGVGGLPNADGALKEDAK